jgi:hypothetical protein
MQNKELHNLQCGVIRFLSCWPVPEQRRQGSGSSMSVLINVSLTTEKGRSPKLLIFAPYGRG